MAVYSGYPVSDIVPVSTVTVIISKVLFTPAGFSAVIVPEELIFCGSFQEVKTSVIIEIKKAVKRPLVIKKTHFISVFNYISVVLISLSLAKRGRELSFERRGSPRISGLM